MDENRRPDPTFIHIIIEGNDEVFPSVGGSCNDPLALRQCKDLGGKAEHLMIEGDEWSLLSSDEPPTP